MYKQPYSLSGSTRAFTLIELSIVLVIIGLIVGGVLVGRDLIQAAKVRQTVSQITEFKTAANTFIGKYNCVPGDCKNAATFLSPVWNGTSGVLDGDGNNQIANLSIVDPLLYNEPFQFWTQLSAAGLIKGKYTGDSGPGSGFDSIPGINVPISALGDNMGYTVVYTEGFTHPADFTPCVFCKIVGHIFFLGTSDANSMFDGYRTDLPAFSPSTAYAIDSKIDDGYPGRGSVIIYRPATLPGFFGNCGNSTDPTTAVYLVSSNANSCNLVFSNLGF